MWHIETDIFALAVFIIMLVKNFLYKNKTSDIQGKIFYLVLIFSIISNIIDIISSAAMNYVTNWWCYEILMTLYVISMPMLAAIWVCYSYIIINNDKPRNIITRDLLIIMTPYFAYALIAASNPFTGLFFKLTRDMSYSRDILFMSVGVGSIMFYSAIGLIMVLINCRKIQPAVNSLLLIAFFITTACFIWIQLAHPGWLIINASYAIVYICCDITVEDQRKQKLYFELRTKNKELQETLVRAESATHAKTEFLSRMSHDIRTPMNAIIGLTHLAKDETDINIIREYLCNIESSSNFLLGLINDILDMSKIENGDLELKEEPFSKDEFETAILTVIKPLMDNKNLNFVFDMKAEPKCILTDPLRFNQIFFNLLSNASKFTPSGGKVEFITEDLPEKDGKAGIRFIIRDNGIGMSHEFIPHMYDAFSQERSKLTDNSNSTGLGLPIVKSLVDAMDGTISVKSELNVGTEFTIDMYFPLANPADVVDTFENVHRESLKDARILLVEDNEINIYVAQMLLERVGCIITIANNGQEAIDTFNASDENYFDAILMDIRMPVMDGITATRLIRALDRKDAATIPIIAMTADAFEDQQKQTIEAGMSYHLSKPIDPSLLYHVLASYLITM